MGTNLLDEGSRTRPGRASDGLPRRLSTVSPLYPVAAADALPPLPSPAPGTPESEATAQREQNQRTREKLRSQLREGKLDQRMVDLEVRERMMPAFEIISNQGGGFEEMDASRR